MSFRPTLLEDCLDPWLAIEADVGVDVAGGRHVQVTDPSGHAAERDAGVEELGDLEVTEPMEVHPRRQLQPVA